MKQPGNAPCIVPLLLSGFLHPEKRKVTSKRVMKYFMVILCLFSQIYEYIQIEKISGNYISVCTGERKQAQTVKP